MSLSGDLVLVNPSANLSRTRMLCFAMGDGHEVVVLEPIEGSALLRHELRLHDGEGLPDELGRQDPPLYHVLRCPPLGVLEVDSVGRQERPVQLKD